MGVTPPSAWPCLAHRGSGLMRDTERPVQTRFRCASTYRLKLASHTKSLTHYARGTPSLRRAPTACRHSVSGAVSLPSSGCFSPFPHGTCSLSVAKEYLALGDGPPSFPQDSTCPAVLRMQSRKVYPFRLRDYHPLWLTFPCYSSTDRLGNFPRSPCQTSNCILQPHVCNAHGLTQT